MAQAAPLCGLVVGRESTGVLPLAGADWARATLYWNAIDDTPIDSPNQPFADIDQVVASVPNTLVSVEAFPGSVNNNSGPYRASCTNWQSVLTSWRDFWQQATSRYCATNPANHGVVRYWSVWNEPNAWNFLQPRLECSLGTDYCKPDPMTDPSRKYDCQISAAQDYADLVYYAELGRRAGCPSASLVVGEIAQDDYKLTFIDQVLSGLARYGVTPAVYTVHTYDTAAGTVSQVSQYRSTLSNHQVWSPIWVTEAGGPAPGLPVTTCQAAGWDPQSQSCWGNQASFLQDMFRLNQQYASAYNWPRTFVFRAQVLYMPTDEYGIALVNSGQVTQTLSTSLTRGACTGCGESGCVPAQGAYISHFTEPGCKGIESYYLPYDGYGYQCRTWDGNGRCGTIHRTMTNKSYRYNGQCYDAWSSGNTLNDFVTVYR
jgi:hypothetical protein